MGNNGKSKNNKNTQTTIGNITFQGQTNEPPYHFVFNDVALTQKASSKKTDENLSGELKVELTTITESIFGCYRKETDIKIPLEYRKSDSQKQDPLIKKPELFPAFFNKRSLIQGASILGMLRHNAGALTNAPMKHVQEQSFSYRPSIAHASKETINPLVTLPAEIISKTPLVFKVITEPNACIFVTSKAGKKILQKSTPETSFSLSRPADFLKIKDKGPSRSIYHSDEIRNTQDFRSIDLDHKESGKFFIKKYKGAIDENGILSLTKRLPYKYVLIKETGLSNSTEINGQHLVDEYNATTQHLCDNNIGHISSRHPKLPHNIQELKNKIENNRDYEIGQIVFVEAQMENDEVQKLLSFGNNYLYRWKYQNTLHTQKVAENKTTQRDQLNPISCSVDLNVVDKLFGFVNGESTRENKLAGAISINHALEQPNEKGKFYTQVHSDNALKVELKPLGAPKASASEFYLKQKENKQNDLVPHYGYTKQENLNYDLAGRKFYLHQKAYKPANKVAKSENKYNKLATTAHLVAPAGTNYRMSLRYKNLTEEELGLIVLALSPDLIKHCELPEKHEKALLPFKQTNNEYANKLGYARPLGYGSVKFSIISDELDELLYYIYAFLDSLENVNHLVQWLSICQFDKELSKTYDYPNLGEESYKVHSHIRKLELVRRREEFFEAQDGACSHDYRKELSKKVLKPIKKG